MSQSLKLIDLLVFRCFLCTGSNGVEREVKHGPQAVHVILGVRLAINRTLFHLSGAILHHFFMTTLLKLELSMLQFNLRKLCLAHRYAELRKVTIDFHRGMHISTALLAAQMINHRS